MGKRRKGLSDVVTVKLVTTYKISKVMTLKEWLEQGYAVLRTQWIYDPHDDTILRGSDIYDWAQAHTKYSQRKVGIIVDYPEETHLKEYRNYASDREPTPQPSPSRSTEKP